MADEAAEADKPGHELSRKEKLAGERDYLHGRIVKLREYMIDKERTASLTPHEWHFVQLRYSALVDAHEAFVEAEKWSQS